MDVTRAKRIINMEKLESHPEERKGMKANTKNKASFRMNASFCNDLQVKRTTQFP